MRHSQQSGALLVSEIETIAWGTSWLPGWIIDALADLTLADDGGWATLEERWELLGDPPEDGPPWITSPPDEG